jgi:hypothetical protein
MLLEVGMFRRPKGFLRTLMNRNSVLRCSLAPFFLLVAAGCAHTPAGVAGPPPRQLLLTETVAGLIAPEDFYYLAMDFSGDAAKGPVPVIGPPWGNGWGAGSITHYVLIHGNQAQVYRIRPGTNLLGSDFLGRPFDFRPPVNSGTLSVTLDMDTLIDPTSSVTFTNVNFINTDRVDVDPRFNGPKLVDAFGDNGTRFVPIPIRTNRVFTNQDFSGAGEPQGDVLLVPDRIPANAPDLDIVNWQIEVRRQ